MEMTGNARVLYEFGSFTLDCGQGVLLHKGEPVHLAPKSLDILAYLLERPNEVVSKEDLMEAVWPDSFVEEANLVVHISAIRKLLASNGVESISIDTFPKKGYRISGDIRANGNTKGLDAAEIQGTASINDSPVIDEKKGYGRLLLTLSGLVAVLLTTWLRSKSMDRLSEHEDVDHHADPGHRKESIFFDLTERRIFGPQYI